MSLFCQLILPKATFLILSYLADEVTLTCYYTQQLLPLLFLSFSLNGSLICTQEEVQNLSSHAAAAAKSLQSCPTLCDPVDGSPLLRRPWDSPGKNTGVGCHFLLQRMKVKSESEVAQSCPTLCNPTGCSQPGYSVHGILP